MKNKILTVAFLILILMTVSDEAIYASSDTFLCLKEMVDDQSKQAGYSKILYVLNGGCNNVYNPDCVYEGQEICLGQPQRFGYFFDGWYVDRYYTQRIDKVSYQKDKGIIVYAKWTRKVNNSYNVENYEYTNRAGGSIKLLKECNYSFFEELRIPGMPETKENDFLNNYIFSESQCPQGLCITDDYVIITSYSEGSSDLGELMVFDKESGEYLVTLGMDSKSHLGGIAFDGKNVWVCNSSNRTLERISYDFIRLMATENRKKVVDASKMVDVYKINNTPSCITFHDSRLWVATHSKFMNTEMVAYYYNIDTDTIEQLSSYAIPAKVQGISFDEADRVYLSTSYGRKSSSYLKIYNSVIDLASNPDMPDTTIEMPPGSEELDMSEDVLYVIFESAGEKYLEGTDGKGYSLSPIDKILQIDITTTF